MLRQEVLTRTQKSITSSILKPMDNLAHLNGLKQSNQQLTKELEHARELIRNYEALIIELQNDNDANLKRLTHDLSNPLQILSMTIESLQDAPVKDISMALERMKRSTDTMTEIISAIRRLRAAKNYAQQKTTQVV
jgi:signal transduction histidine kinase